MDETILREAGHRLYGSSPLKEMKGIWVFRARCRMYKDVVGDLLDFFCGNAVTLKYAKRDDCRYISMPPSIRKAAFPLS